MKNKIIVAGAGISGASIARILAEQGFKIEIYEKHSSVGGLARETAYQGFSVSEFGPHIFRTTKEVVWEFVNRFGDFVPYAHHVLTEINGVLEEFPPLLSSTCEERPDSSEFESVGQYLLKVVGAARFQKYYEEYTIKRWGVSAFDLSSDMIPLIPVFRAINGFFSEVCVGLPEGGYSRMIENMLDHENIQIKLGFELDRSIAHDGIPLIWTARPDILVGAEIPLQFRAVRQEFQPIGEWGYKNASVINYPSREVPYLRKTNYSLLSSANPPVIGYEYSEATGSEAYPIRTHGEVRKWVALKSQLSALLPNVILHGRLAEFKYSSMDQSIIDSFKKVREIRELLR